MNYRRRALEGLLCLLYLVAIAVSARENECSDILQQGIYDQYKITSKSAFQAKVKEFFSKSWDQLSDAKLFANRSALFANDAESAMTAVRRQIRNHGPALLPDGTDPDVGQQTNTDLHRSLLDLRGTRSCAERVLLAFGEPRQTNIDLGLAGNARIVANAADPFDTPEQIVIRERINCVNSLAHWQIITESESIKEPRGRSHSQSYSQIALLHSHLFLHDQLTFADISGTDTSERGKGRHPPS